MSACNARDLGSIPGSGRSPGEGNGNPLQYSCLENPMDGGAWSASVHGVTKSQTRLSDFTSLSLPLELTGWISLYSKGLSRVFSNTTVQKHQFFGPQLSLWFTFTSLHDHWKNRSFWIDVHKNLTPKAPFDSRSWDVLLGHLEASWPQFSSLNAELSLQIGS